MGVIAFGDGPESVWQAARWVYRRLMGDLAAAAGSDGGIRDGVEQAIHLDGLHFDLLDPALASRIFAVLETVAQATVKDARSPRMRWKEGLNERARIRYQSAVRELLELLGRHGEQFRGNCHSKR